MNSELITLVTRALSDLISARALERLIVESAEARGVDPESIDQALMSDMLKREIFKRVQLSVSGPMAKRRVSEVLQQVATWTPAGAQSCSDPEQQGRDLSALEEASGRFALYFDWPEGLRLRALLGALRSQHERSIDISHGLNESRALVGALERRLEEGLVRQGASLAEIIDALSRVEAMGGREVRRLKNLVEELRAAQSARTLALSELERASELAYRLRRTLETSAVSTVDGAQGRVLALEQERVGQLLAQLSEEFGELLREQPPLRAMHDAALSAHRLGQSDEAQVLAWRQHLVSARADLVNEQRARLQELKVELQREEYQHLIQAAESQLSLGQLASGPVNELELMLLEHQGGQNMGALREELTELEEAVRTLSLTGEASILLNLARAQMSAGQPPELDRLWSVIERERGRVAQERENLNDRAARVLEEYDQVRALAGETIQRLGRLAQTLRAQRNLGQMSGEAQQHFASVTEQAEGLLAEAQAEYKAAQEVTATFGDDAMDLLGIFDI